MPHAGLNWTRDTIGGHAKILLGIRAIETPGKSTTGIYSHQQDWYNMVCDIMPFFPDWLKQGTTKHKIKPAEVVARRAYECRPRERGGKNELARFLQPDWKQSYDFIQNLYTHQRTIKLDDLCDVMASRFRIQFAGQPGVYILQHIKTPQQVYLGKGEDLAIRPFDHTGGFLRIAFGFPCASNANAVIFEDLLHNLLQGLGDQIVEYRPGTRGAYWFQRDVDGALQVMLLAEKYCRQLFHQTVEVAPILKPQSADQLVLSGVWI